MRKTELKFNLSAADVILEISCQNLGYYRELKENYKKFLSKMFKVVQEIVEKIPSYELYFTLSLKPQEIMEII